MVRRETSAAQGDLIWSAVTAAANKLPSRFVGFASNAQVKSTRRIHYAVCQLFHNGARPPGRPQASIIHRATFPGGRPPRHLTYRSVLPADVTPFRI